MNHIQSFKPTFNLLPFHRENIYLHQQYVLIIFYQFCHGKSIWCERNKSAAHHKLPFVGLISMRNVFYTHTSFGWGHFWVFQVNYKITFNRFPQKTPAFQHLAMPNTYDTIPHTHASVSFVTVSIYFSPFARHYFYPPIYLSKCVITQMKYPPPVWFFFTLMKRDILQLSALGSLPPFGPPSFFTHAPYQSIYVPRGLKHIYILQMRKMSINLTTKFPVSFEIFHNLF